MHRIEDVVARGMCVGCGGCSAVTRGAVPLTLGRYGSFEPELASVPESDRRLGSSVCPFSDESDDEDSIARRVFPSSLKRHDIVGSHSGVFAGRVSDEDYLLQSSSGGLTSWTADRLLANKLVDGIIHVSADDGSGDRLFSYSVSSDRERLQANRKSDYYATSFASILNEIRNDGRTYALIGVPCFIRAARLVCDRDPVLGSQVKYFLGLVCGHLKGPGFAESLSWQLGVPPNQIESVDFRVKVPGRSASNYDFGVKSKDSDDWVTGGTPSLVGGNWGHGMFQLNSCNYCDDIFAETADVAFGDAWLDEYKEDWRGTNIVVVRNDAINQLLREGIDSGELELDEISPDEAARSQGGNYRHRRVGLSIRLQDDLDAGVSTPKKRVEPNRKAGSRQRVRLVRQRRKMSELSFTLWESAKASGDLRIFLDGMAPLVDQYKQIDRGHILLRIAIRLRNVLRRVR